MGTRNLTMVKKNGEFKVAQYGQWDGYPSGQGLTVLNFCKDKSKLEKLKETVDKIKFIGEEEATLFNERLKRHEASTEAYYERYLSRDVCAKILENIIEVDLDTILLQDHSNFIKDSLFCEWAYCINFDTNMLEVYSWGEKKRAEFSLDNLPAEEEFLELDKEYDD